MLEMKTYVKILIILMCAGGLIAWVRDSFDIGHIARVLPGCSGSDVPLSYTLGSIMLVLLMLWGLRRLKRLGRDNGNQPDDNSNAGPGNYPAGNGNNQNYSGKNQYNP